MVPEQKEPGAVREDNRPTAINSMDNRINMAEILTTGALVEMDPWTQEWIRLAAKEERIEEQKEDT